MYKVIEAGKVGLADGPEKVQRRLQGQLNALGKEGYRVVAATAEMVIMENDEPWGTSKPEPEPKPKPKPKPKADGQKRGPGRPPKRDKPAEPESEA